MTTAATSLLGLALPVTGELSGTWGDTVNNSITSLLDSAVAGTTTLSTDGDVTLTTTTLATNQARQAILLCSGARTAIRNITAPAQSKIYTIINATTGGYAVVIRGAGPTTGVTVPNGASATVAWNGSDFVDVSAIRAGMAIKGNISATGTITTTDTTDSTTYLTGSVITAGGAGIAKDLFVGSDLNIGAANAVTNTTFTIATLNATPSNVRTVFTQSYNGQLTLNNDAGINASTSSNRQFAFQIAGTQGLNLNQKGLYIGEDVVNAGWASNFKVLQFGVALTAYGSIAQQTTSNCNMSYGWNVYGTGDEAFSFQKTGDSASRWVQNGANTYWTSSGATGTAAGAITFYTPLFITQTSASATAGRVGVNTIAPNVALQVLGPTMSNNSVQSQYALGVGNGSGYELTLGTDSTYSYIQTWNTKHLYILPQGNNLYVGAGSTVFGGTTAYGKLQVNGATGTTFYMYGTDNAAGSYNQSSIAHKFNYTGTSQTDGSRITFTRSANTDGNYGAELSFATRPNGGSVTAAVQIDSAQRMLQLAGRKSNAYVLGNQQMWVGSVTSVASGGNFSLFYINQIYDNLCYELDIFVNRGGFFAAKYAGVFGYNGFTKAITTGDTTGAALSITGSTFNETMTVTNSSGATVNEYVICLRVWGLSNLYNVATGGQNLVVSSYLTRIE